MEIRPPYGIGSVSNESIRTGKVTHDVVVLAADHVGIALAAGTDANDGDGRAVDAEEDVNAINDNTEKTEEKVPDRIDGLRRRIREMSQLQHTALRLDMVANLHGTVAALDGARGAGRASTGTGRRRGGRSHRDRLGWYRKAASPSGQGVGGHGGREKGKRHGEEEGEDRLGVHDARWRWYCCC